ncbi:MAG: glycosyltransferase [Rhodobacteraceae bacterium]|nr:MAG: glycosyltransferase [Paracoccaceae bacterium]
MMAARTEHVTMPSVEGRRARSWRASRGAFMKVVFVVPRFHTNLAFAMRALIDDAITPTLVVRAPGAPTGLDLPAPVVFADGASLADARALLAEKRPDLVVIRKTPGLGAPFHRAGLIARVPMLAYDLRPWRRPRHWSAMISGWLRGRPGRRITPVPGAPGSGPPDPRAFYLPFPVSSAPEEPSRRDGPFRILFVGKLAQIRKRPFMLIEATERLARLGDLRLTMVGSTSLEINAADPDQLARLRAYAANGPLGDRFRLIEDAPFDAMPGIYAEHDVCVLPATNELLGIAPLEAMGRGAAAVISSDAGSAGYVTIGRAAGFDCGAVFPDGDAAALEAALLPYLRDPEARWRARRDAWLWVRQAFSPQGFAAGFRAVAAKVAHSSAPSRP